MKKEFPSAIPEIPVRNVDAAATSRNTLLYQFANDQKLTSYDGMDVGPVELKH